MNGTDSSYRVSLAYPPTADPVEYVTLLKDMTLEQVCTCVCVCVCVCLCFVFCVCACVCTSQDSGNLDEGGGRRTHQTGCNSFDCYTLTHFQPVSLLFNVRNLDYYRKWVISYKSIHSLICTCLSTLFIFYSQIQGIRFEEVHPDLQI